MSNIFSYFCFCFFLIWVIFYSLFDYNKKNDSLNRINAILARVDAGKVIAHGVFNSAGFHKLYSPNSVDLSRSSDAFCDSLVGIEKLSRANHVHRFSKNKCLLSNASNTSDYLLKEFEFFNKKYPNVEAIKLCYLNSLLRTNKLSEIESVSTSTILCKSIFNVEKTYSFYYLISHSFYDSILGDVIKEELDSLKGDLKSLLSEAQSAMLNLFYLRDYYIKNSTNMASKEVYLQENLKLIKLLNSIELDMRIREIVSDSDFQKYLTLRYSNSWNCASLEATFQKFPEKCFDNSELKTLCIQNLISLRNYKLNQRFYKDFSKPLLLNNDYFLSLKGMKKLLDNSCFKLFLKDQLFEHYKYRIERVLNQASDSKKQLIIETIAEIYERLISMPIESVYDSWKITFSDIFTKELIELNYLNHKQLKLIFPELSYISSEIN